MRDKITGPRAGRRAARWTVGVAVFATCLLGTGLTVDWLQARDATYPYLKLFNEILQLVRSSYVEEVEVGELVHGAYDGLLGALDPESEYLTAEQYERLTRQPPEDEGDVGLDLSRRGGYLQVVSVLPGSPAEEAGLTAATRLRRIAGVSTRELTVAEGRLRLRGRVGTEVVVQRFPGGKEPEEVVLVRRRIEGAPPSLRHEAGAAILRLATLPPGTAAAARAALGGVAPGERLLLDLRGASTGDYDEAVEVASLFLRGAEVGRIRGRDGEDRVLRAKVGEETPRPVAVLVDRGTAGPAELLAQALRARGGALLLGGKTFGRGTLQEFIPLQDGGYLRLSVARCLDPDGNAWDGSGLTPDHLLDEEKGAWVTQALGILERPAAERPAA